MWPGGTGWPEATTVATPRSVLSIPAASRALNLIAGTVSQLPMNDVRADGTLWPTRPILDDPWPMMGRAEWLTFQLHALIVLGDAIALPTDFDVDGFARQLVPVDPRLVNIYVDPSSGQVVYDFYLGDSVLRLGRADVWHAKGLYLTSDGLRGIGTIAQFSEPWNAALELQRYGRNAYGSGVPSGIVKVHLREVGQEQASQIKDDWRVAFRDRVPAILSELMDFTPIAWSPHDMEWLAAAQFSVAQVAMMFNLDPTDLDTSLGSSMTYANREQRAYERLLTSIGPLLVRFEQAFRFVLPRLHACAFDRAAVLWSDASTRAWVQNTELTDGTLTINEARQANGRPPFGEWADLSSHDPDAIPETVAPVPTPAVASADAATLTGGPSVAPTPGPASQSMGV